MCVFFFIIQQVFIEHLLYVSCVLGTQNKAVRRYIQVGDLETNQVSDRWREDRVRAFQGVGDGRRSSSV